MDRANATVLLRGDSYVATQRIKEAFALKNYLLRKRNWLEKDIILVVDESRGHYRIENKRCCAAHVQGAQNRS